MHASVERAAAEKQAKPAGYIQPCTTELTLRNTMTSVISLSVSSCTCSAIYVGVPYTA